MSAATVEKSISEMTTAELEKHLANRKKAETAKLNREKKQYEKERDAVIDSLINRANEIHQYIKTFKEDCAEAMQAQHKKLEEYGKIRGNSKGGFTIKHSNNLCSITRRRDTEPQWDERSVKAVELLKDFLGDVVKKRDINAYEILMTFLEKNSAGDLEYSRVMDLLSHEARYTDERWLEGLRLIKQSYSNVMRAFGYEFKVKPVDGDKFETLSLNFSSL